MASKQIPLGTSPSECHTLTPYLVVHRPDDLIDFLTKAFGASEEVKRYASNGRLTYAEMGVGDSILMITEATASNPASPSNINVCVDDVDMVFETAVKAGGTPVSNPSDTSDGERTGVVKDNTGNRWLISAPINKTSDERQSGKTIEAS